MPEFDSTHPQAYLIQLCIEYKETIDQIGSGLYETEEVYYLTGQRAALHDDIIREMERLGIPIADREDAMKRAIRIAQWLRPPE